LPLGDQLVLEKYFSEKNIYYCINCAAYTFVDKAEEEKKLAFEINSHAVRDLARTCKKYKTQLIHISTDYVFNGNSKTTYTEFDKSDPVNVYGQSKLQGENFALENNPRTIIIRTSWLYSSYGKNFVKTMIRLMNEKESIQVVNDQVGSPTYAADLAKAIIKIIEENELPKPGIYHYCNKGIISWYDFANAIKQILKSDCKINPITTVDFPTAAKRPVNSGLNTTKIEKQFGITIPGWNESLVKCMEKIMKSPDSYRE